MLRRAMARVLGPSPIGGEDLLRRAALKWQLASLQACEGVAAYGAPSLPPVAGHSWCRSLWVPACAGHAPRELTAVRSLSSFTAADQAREEDPTKVKLVKVLVLMTMLAAGVKVAPFVAVQTVGHAVRMLDAKENFLVGSGISRLRLLLQLEAAAPRALESGAVPRLLRVVEQRGSDDGLADAALGVLEDLAAAPGGTQALREAGAAQLLSRYAAAAAGRPSARDPVYRAQRLLATMAASAE